MLGTSDSESQDLMCTKKNCDASQHHRFKKC